MTVKQNIKILETEKEVQVFITEEDKDNTYFLIYDEEGGGDFRFKLRHGAQASPYLTLTKEVFNSLKETMKSL